MLEIIISTIFLISPGDSISTPFDITILFDPPVAEKSINVYLDGTNLPGEIKSGYFFSETSSLSGGKHKIKVETENETEEWSFMVTEKKEDTPYTFTGNLSVGNHNSYFADTSFPGENEVLLGLDFSVFKNENYLRFSLYHDPQYQIEWYPYFSYLKGKSYLEVGYISPYLHELTICSPGGLGLSGEIGAGNFFINPVILYSENYDTLFAEYPRWLLGGKTAFKKNQFYMGVTAFYGEDDTSNIIGFTFEDPAKSSILSGETEFGLNKLICLKIKGAFSTGNYNLYADSTIKGTAFEGKLIFESELNNIEAGIRTVSDGYLTLGNAYLYQGRTSGFINGVYEKGCFLTYVDYLAYQEYEMVGISLNQSFKLKISDNFSPILEYRWAKYPEYQEEKYSYIGLGFEAISGSLQMENTIGIEKTTYIEETRSFRILSNVSWYHEKHILSVGIYTYINGTNTSFDFNVDGTLSLGSFGNININYYPYLENGYDEHLLRIIYEYDF
ncbi:hypothetical protein JW879_00720 [candidate division WOR-3 bacterium]|nr:hypothetical protein [candidate division WOR-3 bacterium]